jgi:hypothetical protein
VQPRHFVLYGLKNGHVAHTEPFVSPALEDAIALARARRPGFHKIEVWEGVVCVYRDPARRDQPPPLAT